MTERNIQTKTKSDKNKYLHNNQSFIVYTKHTPVQKKNYNNNKNIYENDVIKTDVKHEFLSTSYQKQIHINILLYFKTVTLNTC